MNITAIIYDADARRTAYILGTVIGNCKLFPAERAPRDWSGYANVITVAAGEDGPVVTAGVQKRVTFRPKGEDETVAAAETMRVEDDAIELSGRNRTLHVLDALRGIEEAGLQKLLRQGPVGILRIERLPADEIRLLEDNRRVAGLLDVVKVPRVVERRQVQPQEAVRVADRIALLSPLLLHQELFEIGLLDVDKVLRTPQLREDDRIVDRLAAADDRRGREANLRALLGELRSLVREDARLFEPRRLCH